MKTIMMLVLTLFSLPVYGGENMVIDLEFLKEVKNSEPNGYFHKHYPELVYLVLKGNKQGMDATFDVMRKLKVSADKIEIEEPATREMVYDIAYAIAWNDETFEGYISDLPSQEMAEIVILYEGVFCTAVPLGFHDFVSSLRESGKLKTKPNSVQCKMRPPTRMELHIGRNLKRQ